MSGAGSEPNLDKVFELRTYVAREGRLDDLQRWWRDHIAVVYCDHLHVRGIFVSQPKDEPAQGISVLIEYDRLADADRAIVSLRADPRVAALNALPDLQGPDIVEGYTRVFLYPTDFSPPV